MREKTQVFNKSIGVVRANAGGQRVGEAIASAADTMARITFEDAARRAEKRGVEVAKSIEQENLTTFNPMTGKPEAFEAPKGFGTIAADAYQRVIDSRFEDSVNTELQLKAKEISLKYEYNADAYGEVFSDYIAKMSENAEGHYKNFIQTNGAKYLASTTLNIKEKAIARSRQQLSERLGVKIQKGLDAAQAAAAAGGFMPAPDGELSEAEQAAQTVVQNASDGEKSFLLKGGSTVGTTDEANFAIAKGAIEYIISKTSTPSQRTALDLAIRTGGASGMAQLPNDVRKQVEGLLPYVSVGSKEQLLRHSSVVAGDYDADWKAKKDLAIEIAKQNDIYATLDFFSTVNAIGQASERQVIGLFNQPEYDDFGNETGQMRPPSALEITGSISLLENKYWKASSGLIMRYASGAIEKSELERDQKEAREAILQNLLIPLASLGSVENLKLALTNPYDDASYLGLADVQKEFVAQILESNFFKDTDHDFVQSTLNGIKNTAKIKTDEMRANFQLTEAVNIAGSMAASGNLSKKDLAEVISKVQSNIKDGGYTDTQANSHISGLKVQQALGISSTFGGMRGMNSRTINQLELYVRLKGEVEDPTQFPSIVAEHGNRILELVDTNESLNAVVSKISGIRATLTTAETKDRLAIEQKNLMTSINNGTATKSDVKTREAVDSAFAQQGIELSNFNNLPDNDKAFALHFLRNGGSEVLSDALSNMADGQKVVGAESFIKLYGLLSTDLVPGRTEPTNQLEPYFNNDVQDQLLKDAFTIYTAEGKERGIDVIINEMSAKRNDPVARLQAKEILDNKTPSQVALALTNNDVSLAPEIAPLVEYFSLTGFNYEQIKKRVETIIEQKYPKSINIIDTSLPVGSITRSRFAIKKVIPDDQTRAAFYNRINSNLEGISKGMGIRLRINDGSTPEVDPIGTVRPIALAGIALAIDALGLASETDIDPNFDSNVYLRPDPSGASDRYYVYYNDKNNELQPLSYPADNQGNYLEGGKPFWYSLTPRGVVGDIMDLRALIEEQKLKTEADANAANQNLISNWLTKGSPAESADFMMNRLNLLVPEATRPEGN